MQAMSSKYTELERKGQCLIRVTSPDEKHRQIAAKCCYAKNEGIVNGSVLRKGCVPEDGDVTTVQVEISEDEYSYSDDVSRSEKWFWSMDDATAYLEEFSESLNTTLIKVYTFTYEVQSKKIYWDNESMPYIILARETYIPGFQKQLLKDKNSIKDASALSLLKVQKFPQFQLKVDTTYYRTHASKGIKKAFSEGTETASEIMYCVKLPTTLFKTDGQALVNPEVKTLSPHMIKVVASFQEVERVIEEFQLASKSKFIYYSNEKYDTSKSKIRWDDVLTPYVAVQHKQLVCQYGKDYNKVKNASRKSNKFKQPNPGTRKRAQRCSKKVGCKAKIKIMQRMEFPQYKISSKNSFEQTQIAKAIRQSLADADPSLLKQTVINVYLPSPDHHTGHALDESSAAWRVEASEQVRPMERTPEATYVPMIESKLEEIRDLVSCMDGERELAEVLYGLNAVASIASNFLGRNNVLQEDDEETLAKRRREIRTEEDGKFTSEVELEVCDSSVEIK